MESVCTGHTRSPPAHPRCKQTYRQLLTGLPSILLVAPSTNRPIAVSHSLDVEAATGIGHYELFDVCEQVNGCHFVSHVRTSAPGSSDLQWFRYDSSRGLMTPTLLASDAKLAAYVLKSIEPLGSIATLESWMDAHFDEKEQLEQCVAENDEESIVDL
jgi:hypothetical protein